MSLIYLYGFVPSDVTLPEGSLLGIGDTEVELISLDGFAAAVGRVDEAAYGPEAIEPRTDDLEWMAEQGLRHEQVVAWFVDHASILPSRLLTLFSGESVLRDTAGSDADRIRATLDRFGGVREWDLKVAYSADELVAHLGEVSDQVKELDQRIEAAGPGTRFLLEKKRKDLARTESRAAARRLAGELLDEVRPEVEDVVVLRPPGDAPVVLNAALLVPREREARLRDRVEREAERLGGFGLTVGFSGPWAPYRFLDDDD